jgi:hypothetical protein
MDALSHDGLLPPQSDGGWKFLQPSSRNSAVPLRKRHRPSTNAPNPGRRSSSQKASPTVDQLEHVRAQGQHSHQPLTFSRNGIGNVRLAAEATLSVTPKRTKDQEQTNWRARSRFRRWYVAMFHSTHLSLLSFVYHLVSEHCPCTSLPLPLPHPPPYNISMVMAPMSVLDFFWSPPSA